MAHGKSADAVRLAQSLLSQVYFLAMRECHLSDLYDVPQGSVFRLLTSLSKMQGSRRMCEFLCRFGEDLVRLREFAVC